MEKRPNAGRRKVLKKVLERRQIGAYYTPTLVAEMLCRWAITKPQSLILEPSFGGCEFLDSSIRRLEELGCLRPELQIFGCDIDATAFEYLSKRPNLLQPDHFLEGDFLNAQPGDFGSRKFDVVIGNPPYVRHHKLSIEQKRRAQEIRQLVLPKLNLQASLWGLFLIHSSQFLAEGGRFAWLLPSSFSYSDYAKMLRLFMQNHFEEIKVVRLDQRLFEQQGTTEGTVVVVAAGWKRIASRRLTPIQDLSAATTRNLRSALLELRPSQARKKDAYEKLIPKSVRLGDHCSFQIGTVTGDARFFLFDKERAATFGISNKNLSYIVNKGSHVPGIVVTASDLRRIYEEGSKVKIFNPAILTPDAVRYIDLMPQALVERNVTFNKRPLWYRPCDNKESDAFFTGMSHRSPRLILNCSGTTCTNSLYRVSFKGRVSDRGKKILAVSLLSSFGQLSAERVGRAYSAGMLKHEPSNASSIRVLIPKTSIGLKKVFQKVDSSLRLGDLSVAQNVADRFLMANGALSAEDCLQLERLLAGAREARMPPKQKSRDLNHSEDMPVEGAKGWG